MDPEAAAPESPPRVAKCDLGVGWVLHGIFLVGGQGLGLVLGQGQDWGQFRGLED